MEPPTIHPDNERPSHLDLAIAAYLESVARGAPLSREQLLAEHADCQQELAQFFSDHDRMMQAARPWQSAAHADPAAAEGTLSQKDGDATTSMPASESANQRLETPPGGLASVLKSGRFGDYQLLEKVAQGGMGVVYKARQLSLNRVVALKMILRGQYATAQDQDRFRLEAEAAAKLRHPHIVVVHEFGQDGDQLFFSMEYVEGRSLADLVRQGPVAPTEAVQYVRQVAEAVHYAHHHGVLHRDVKPSNVLIDVSGHARVTDFGLAKRIDADEELTLTGQLVGTPAYMAPEQISSALGVVGPACDVYGLGVVLYELLTGQPPYRTESQVETLLAVLEGDPPPPRQIRPDIPIALEMIALKCLEKNPNLRYASAEAVATDLERYLQGESLSISSPNVLQRMARSLERSRFDREVYAASLFVTHSAWIALATHAAVFVNYLAQTAHPLATVIAIRLAEVAVMGLAVWPRRKEWLPARGAAARQLWSIWLGYLAGSLTLLAIDYVQSPSGEPYYSLRAYPSMAVLASLAFWMLGSSYWGYCYIFAGLFLTIAVVMPFWLPAGPLVFGLAWAASLALLGVRLRRLNVPSESQL